jgi:rare lipoprotein A
MIRWIGSLLVLTTLSIPAVAKPHHHHHFHVYRQIGMASWYGPGFYGRRTASGAIYTGNRMTAAHNTIPLGSHVRVIDLRTHRSVGVQITDRGSFGRKYHRVIDLSKRAANRLHMHKTGVDRVVVVWLRRR